MQRTIYGPEHAAFAASIQAFVERDLRPNLERYRREGAVDRQAWKQAGAVGLLGLAAPEWAGGAVGDQSDYRFRAAAIEQLAAASHGLSSTFSIHFDIVMPYVVDLADDHVARTWLPRMVDGSAIAALALTEPGAGSDLAAITTRAQRDGDDWVLDGAKTFITNGGIADVAVVAARTSGDDAAGISLFLVPTNTPGVSAGAPLDKLGLHESNTAELALTQVRIPADHLLGQLDRGFAHLMDRLPTERLSSSVANLAQARAGLALAIAYGKERRAFGTPVGSLQHNAFQLADLSARVEATSAFVDACIAAKVKGVLSGADAARAKLLSAQVEHDVLDAAMQLHGGSGYMADSAIGQAWVDGRVTRIWAGSAEVMRLIISRDLGL
jgi:alkylation response protein AidB-like acyl-CoA dehydrogenase